MVGGVLSRRRALCAALAILAAGPTPALAGDVIDLDWDDLLPEGETALPPELEALIDHTGPDMSRRQPVSSGVRTDWNGQIVRLPGFVVPIDYDGTGVSTFILVPYVGACVHVPPPPANQLVFVTSQTPYQSKGLYEPVNVVGRLATASVRTELAAVGYALSATRIEPYT